MFANDRQESGRIAELEALNERLLEFVRRVGLYQWPGVSADARALLASIDKGDGK